MIRERIFGVRRIASELWTGGRGWILVGVASGWFLSLGVRLIFPALLPYIRDEFALNFSIIGLLVSTLWVAYALGQFPGGIIGDRIGEGNALVASTVCSGFAIVVVTVSWTLRLLFIATAVFGLSTALFGPARFTILSAIYDEKDGTAIGLTLSAGEAGNAILPVIAGGLATAVSWRAGFGVTVPAFFLVAALIFWTIPSRVSEGNDGYSFSLSTLRYVLDSITDRLILLISSIHFLLFFVYQGFTGFYPTYLVEAKGVSPGVAATLFGWFFVIGILVQPAAGAGGDRLGVRPTLLVVAAVSTIALGILPFVHGTLGLVLVTTVASTLLGSTPLTQTYLVNKLPETVSGTGLGLLRTVYIGLGATGPVVVGAIADRGFFDVAFFGLAAVAAISIVASLSLPKSE
ncbi:MFS transporter [Halopiger aswanensis]|uniref:Sugar phosphate permease n=1 Tax=Halopiger aswanensis TaxID=148449 RepID=A0A419VXV6_9EURY|nr:MFS transporter [Halopiger aswanensis]RKD88038.1 sugar phosphate permease [Halopiger aswanensis]